MQKIQFKKLLIPALFIALASPSIGLSAEARFEISAWIPYWRYKEGIASISPHLDNFFEVNPFIYSVRKDGSLYQNSAISESEWVGLKAQTKQRGIKFIPTITWGNADAIDSVLGSPSKRQEHIRAITKEVYANNYDGIDIDYEGKYAKTKDSFSAFLKGLYEAIGYDKFIVCTIESRTPLDSRYETAEDIPKDIEYANDFAVINKYCDRVAIMAYDQGRIDLKLNKKNTDPYAPVADKEWVEKVLTLALEEINKDKIVIGVPTYGYEYDVFANASGVAEYSRLWSLNPGYATETAGKLGINPVRNSAGEMQLVYPASKSPDPIIPLPNATRLMSWSDAEAIRQKAELAEKLGVRGIAVFKIDGGQDLALWSMLSAYKDKKVTVASDSTSGNGEKAGITAVNKDLSLGMRTEEVKILQRYLNSKGFVVASRSGGSLGNETTYFGPATRNALIRFQKANKVSPASGYFGPKTRAAIKSAQ